MSQAEQNSGTPHFDAERCLQALSGDAPMAGQPDRSARAGRLLRELVLAELQAQPVESTPDEAALLARLRASGALAGQPEPRAAWPQAALAWLKKAPVTWIGVPTLATVAGVGMVVLMQAPPSPVPLADEDAAAQMRGSEQAQRLATADPKALADALQAQLAARQLPLRRQPLGSGLIELQAKIPPGDAALVQALEQLGVKVPAHGRLWLLIAPIGATAKP